MTDSDDITVSKSEGGKDSNSQTEGFPLPAAIKDRPAETDKLGFAPYVNALKEFITHRDTESPLTISVEGAWGSGKSSFMLQLKEKLENDGDLTVQFNPWRYEHEEALWAAFAIETFEQISDQLSLSERTLGHIRLFRYRIKWRDGWVGLLRSSLWIISILLLTIITPILVYLNFSGTIMNALNLESGGSLSTVLGSGGLALSIAGLLTLWIKIMDYITKPIGVDLQNFLVNPDYQERIPFLQNFHDDFQNILNSYVEDENVYIFIDDLDRCQVPKAAQLMQSINLLLDKDSRLIFIIGMDRKKVAAGVASKHDDIIPYLKSYENNLEEINDLEQASHGLEFGYEYLEKFIQIPFLVPQPTSEDVEGFVSLISNTEDKSLESTIDSSSDSSVLENPLDQHSKEMNEIIHMVSPSLGYNPRTIKKFINLFRLRALLAKKNGLFAWKEHRDYSEGDITLPQLGKFVAISLQWPRLLSIISSNPDILDDLQRIAIESNENIEISPAARIWARREKLMKLLRTGCENDGEKYNLANANIDHLLQISPRVDQPTKLEEEEKRFNQLTEHVKKEHRNVDSTFPWLPFSRSEWKVPCPACDRQIHNTKSAFESHWSKSDNCDGVSEKELERILKLSS